MNKKQQIREIENIIKAECVQWLDKMSYAECLGCAIDSAEVLYNAGYRKISENAVVLTKEEWKRIKNSLYYSKEELEKKLQKASKETAREILQNLYSYPHEYHEKRII